MDTELDDATYQRLREFADAAYFGGFLTTARQALDFVMTCPAAIGNPFLHLRRGEVLFDQGEPQGAASLKSIQVTTPFGLRRRASPVRLRGWPEPPG